MSEQTSLTCVINFYDLELKLAVENVVALESNIIFQIENAVALECNVSDWFVINYINLMILITLMTLKTLMTLMIPIQQ